MAAGALDAMGFPPSFGCNSQMSWRLSRSRKCSSSLVTRTCVSRFWLS